jgi:lipoyl(octanoyl) transferase
MLPGSRPAPLPPLGVLRAGRVPYAEALRWQEARVAERREGVCPDQLILLEHPHVLTAGRGTDPKHILWSEDQRKEREVTIHDVGRGGDVTYHGPGQLVGYPILALEGQRSPGARDLHQYLRDLEAVLIRVLDHYGIQGSRVEGQTGVWTERGKIAAIGVRVSSGWITSHGFALNLAPDLTYFESIIPCGLSDRRVTSMAEILGSSTPSRTQVEDTVIEAFSAHFGRTPVPGVVLEGRSPAGPDIGPVASAPPQATS